jgi:DNA-binding transcriptional LysR family regulator
VVQLGELRDSTMVSQRLAPNDRAICAAPAYLAEHGHPGKREDLRNHACLALREDEQDVTLWRFLQAGKPTTVRIDPVMSSNDGDTVRGWAEDGQGIILRSAWGVADALASGALVRVLDGYRLPSADMRVLLGERSSRAARTRRFVDLLKAGLTPPPWRRPWKPSGGESQASPRTLRGRCVRPKY